MNLVLGVKIPKFFLPQVSLIVLCVSFFWSSPAVAWDNVGHEVTAVIAYQHLTPVARRHVDSLIKIVAPFYPKQKTFVTASTWADGFKQHDVSAFSSWHYIARAYRQSRALPKPVSEHNVVWAIKQSEKILQSTKSNTFEKALFLRFLIHFVGDIHQPLHCIERYSKSSPTGDRGGNKFKIVYGKITNLHSLWDAGVGLFSSFYKPRQSRVQQAERIAKRVQSRYPKKALKREIAETNPSQWAAESYHLAIIDAYLTSEGRAPSMRYLQSNQQVVMKQLALAGYRLAAVLNKLFG